MGFRSFNERGFTLIDFMVSTAIIAVTVLSMIGFQNLARVQNKISYVKGSARLVASRIQEMIKNDFNWDLSVNFAGNTDQLRCFRVPFENHPSCVAGPVAGGIDIRRINGAGVEETYYSTKSATQGLTINGEPCNNFDAVNGSDICPFRVNLELNLHCPAGCEIRTLNIVGRLQYQPRTRGPSINLNGIGFEENRLFDLAISDANCTAFGGTFNDVSRVCTLTVVPQTCPPGQAISGFLNGVIQCLPI